MKRIRSVVYIGDSAYVSIPKDVGFKKGDSVIVEKLDNNVCKITKVEWSKVQ